MQLVNDVWNALVASLAESAPWVVLGFLVAGLLHEYMPQGLLRRHLGSGWSPLVKAVGLGADSNVLMQYGSLRARISPQRGRDGNCASRS